MRRVIISRATIVVAMGIACTAVLVAGCASPPPPAVRYVSPAETSVVVPMGTSVEDARQFLREKPRGEAALTEAQRFRAAGNREADFLLVKYAAREGVPAAAYELGRMYDPATHVRGGVVSNADALRAADWFRWAAHKGHVKAMVRLGEMYEAGVIKATGESSELDNAVPKEILELDATERSLYWFKRAAEEGGMSE